MIAYEPGTDHVEAFVATGTAIALAIAGAASAGTSVYAANKASSTAKEAANTQAGAANHAADLQSKAAADALAFQKQQAEVDFQNSELARRANYDQYAAGRHRLDTLGGLLGQGPQTVPDYVPGKDPNFAGPAPAGSVNGTTAPTTGAPGSVNATTSATGPINWTAPPDQLSAQLSAYFKSKGVSDQETPYWVGKAAELVARGQELNDPGYADRRLSQANVFGGGGGSTAPSATTAPPGSINATGYAPMTAGPITPAIQPPKVSYQPGSIGATTRGY